MAKSIIAMLSIIALALITSCSEQTSTSTSTVSDSEVVENSLLTEWTGPYGGTPAFDKMNLDDAIPAATRAFAESLAEYDAIANNPDAPTFENTIVAMEGAGEILDRTLPYFQLWERNLSSPEYRKIQSVVTPMYSDYQSKIIQNPTLFARIQTVYESEEYKSLRPDQQRLVYLVYDEYEKNGATLQGEAKERYAEINKELSLLHINFDNNFMADSASYVTYLSKDQLGGLPQSFIDAAAFSAKSKDREGQYAVSNNSTAVAQFLTYSDERELRETVLNTFIHIADNGDEHDNNKNIQNMLKLRHERLGLLGYENYASWQLSNTMAKTPENVFNLLETMWKASTARVVEEVADIQAIIDVEGADITLKPWDYLYYSEKVRKEKYDLDSTEIKQYLQLDNLREGMFMVAGEVFNFAFAPISDGSVSVFHEDVKVWEVTDKTSGKHIGLWYLDPFAREGKSGGAWATPYRVYENYGGEQTVLASNNANFIKPAPGEPLLISWKDATTLFHEFGHALHFFSANVAYPTLAMGGVDDYTEFQSQLLERWLLTDEVIEGYLRHVETNQPMPDDMIAKIKSASTFNMGYETTRYLASAMLDMNYHTTDPKNIVPDVFERELLMQIKMPNMITPIHNSTRYYHVFSDEGYAAGYYGYIWSEVLTADAAQAFEEAPGGYYDKEVIERLVKHLFSVQNAVDPAEAYRAFRGRDPLVEALMRSYGFPVPE